MNGPLPEVLKRHLIDPEICIRCNTCEEACPVDAITHDARNYVVMADKCNACMACVPPCPTGAIDNWRTVLRAGAYPIEEQFTWDVLPQERSIGLAPPPVMAELSELDAEVPTPSAAVPGSRCLLGPRRTRMSTCTRTGRPRLPRSWATTASPT